jgi:cytochrome P450
MVTLLLFAGLDTVVSTLGFFAFFLARHPRSRAALLADPALVNNAVEELLRRYSVSVLARQVCAEVDLGGVILRPGEMVMAPIPLDGLDDGKYPDAASVDFSRKVTNHASFGSGVHRCLGSMLARTELRIFLEEWLRRIPDFEIEPCAVIAVTASSVSTIDSLPLVWTVEQLG